MLEPEPLTDPVPLPDPVPLVVPVHDDDDDPSEQPYRPRPRLNDKPPLLKDTFGFAFAPHFLVAPAVTLKVWGASNIPSGELTGI